MVTANTRPTEDRVNLVHFQCSFGAASKGWIRSGRDPQIVINDVYGLNRTGIKIGGKFLIDIFEMTFFLTGAQLDF